MLSNNAQKLLTVLKAYEGKQMPPLAELQAKMDGLHPLPLKCCMNRLIDQGYIVLKPATESAIAI